MGRHAFVVRFEVNDLADGAVDENTLTHVLMERMWRVRKGARLWGEGKTNTDLYEHYLDHRGKKKLRFLWQGNQIETTIYLCSNLLSSSRVSK